MAARNRFLLRFGFGLDAPRAHGLRELFEHAEAFLPAETAVGNRHAVLQRLARHEVLPAGLEMAFHHDPEDARVPCRDLPRHVVPDVDLLLRVLAAVAVAE